MTQSVNRFLQNLALTSIFCTFLCCLAYMGKSESECNCAQPEEYGEDCIQQCVDEANLDLISPEQANNLISILTGVFTGSLEALKTALELASFIIGFGLAIIAGIWVLGFTFFVLVELCLLGYCFFTEKGGVAGLSTWIMLHVQLIIGLIRIYVWWVKFVTFELIPFVLDTIKKLIGLIPVVSHLWG